MLDHCIKCNICTNACPVAAVSDRFPGPKYVGPQAQRFRRVGQPVPDAAVDYCSGCRICNLVCPTGVPIAELNARARAQMVAERGLPLRNWLIAHTDLIGRLSAGPQAPLVNALLGWAGTRWLAEQCLGIHRHAPLPRATRYPFRARKQPRLGRGKQVVYFHGCATRAYEPHVGAAALAVLARQGYEVLVPPQNCCGLPLLSNGDFAAARRAHMANVRHLWPYVQAGVPIVGTSTSCTLTLKEEAPELLDLHSHEVQAVAAATYDIFEFLRHLAERGELCDAVRPLEQELPYHMPCQYRAHRIGQPVVDVLSMIPGLRLKLSPAASCCGIAGTYGLKREKYALAQAVGRPLFSFITQTGSSLALCDSETCRWQISHATGVATKHPIELLAEAYEL
ncbi:anaerobic glycerol-3-phosphate dehydrogenase subunit C [Candidatus Viridilinea mediisalina]|uniref:Anaerobic glycerol-3-phosphate dehydrogenase subunit C n=1 Tax=Candidatus Viridilinea mediisalina TaxID=2024553 RepID=A0A2A6RMQ3_9CHLR|nr:anaerobic glycerol-3-phosphate dehydrogenase subunit C [Candidatus Viridilinea mediisalina]PDW04342.1 anaerobic glycerol-3-phosphate dehydrogenase subunit C [Candidatus Viridilinea mediisalina]